MLQNVASIKQAGNLVGSEIDNFRGHEVIFFMEAAKD